jgi:hypothetical protein
MPKADITISAEPTLTWDRYSGQDPKFALEQLYQDTLNISKQKRDWYWTSIKTKRWTSLVIRWVAFLLLVVGTALPILAGLSDEAASRLLCTQIAVAMLAIAGLLQIADKIFGWSSGWMRYVTTVTAMESATNIFHIEWAKHVCKPDPCGPSDLQPLFAISEALERELIKLQTEETNRWVTEFNAGLSLLDAAIKAQREETQKQIESLRTTVSSAQEAARAEEKAKADAAAAAAKAKQPGAIDIALKFKSTVRPVSVSLDDGAPQEFVGVSWSIGSVAPGLHTIEVKTLTDPKETSRNSVSVDPGKAVKLNVEFAQ